MNNTKISVVIPVYNSANCIQELVDEVIVQLSITYQSFEIILIDDRSKDHSWEQIKLLKSKYPETIKGIRLSKNYGQHSATLAGLNISEGQWVVTMDDDYESPINELLNLLKHATENNYNLTYAVYKNKRNGIIRRGMTYLYKKVAKLEGKNKGLGSSFRVLNRSLVEKVTQHNHYFQFIDETCLWYTENIGYLSMNSWKSKKPKSGYSLFKLIGLTGDVIMYSSSLPLKMVTYFGFILATVNFLIGAFYLIKKIFFNTQVGYTSTIISILFSTGLIILCLGVIAEYLSKVFRNTQGIPAYNEDEKI